MKRKLIWKSGHCPTCGQPARVEVARGEPAEFFCTEHWFVESLPALAALTDQMQQHLQSASCDTFL